MIAPAVASRKRSSSRLRNVDFASTSWSQEKSPPESKPAGNMQDADDFLGLSAVASAQPKPKPEPLEKSYRKVPFANRVNCALTPGDPDFIVLEQYFERLLRNKNLTITEILEDHFTPLEIQQFIPTSKGPMAEEQKHNTAEFCQIMSSTFKGKLSTLSCKMTMLFLGFPVAPMKVGPLQDVDYPDTDARKDSQTLKQDPFTFLDEYPPRTGGTMGISVNVTPDVLSTSLRGGHIDKDEMEIMLSDIDEESSVQWDRDVNDQLTMSLRGGALAYDELPNHSDAAALAAGGSFLQLYGRQGYVGIGSKWAHFVQGVVWLLGSDWAAEDPNATIYVALDLFEGGRLNKEYVQTYEGALYPNVAKYEGNTGDELLAFVTANMNKSHDVQGGAKQRVCFVRLSRDQRPASFRPLGAVTGLIEVSLTGSDSSSTVYMRITTQPSAHNCPSQYATEFQRALNTLLAPKNRHTFVDLRLQKDGNPAEDCGSIYIGQDPPQTLVDLIPPYLMTPNRFQLMATLKAVPAGDIPLLTSIRRDGKSKHPGVAGWIQRHELPDVNQIADVIVDYTVNGRQSKEAVHHVELYLPVQGFVDGSVDPVLCHYEDGRPSAADHIWTSRINAFKAENRGSFFAAGFAIWGRPIYSHYTLVNDLDKNEPIQCVLDNLLDLDIASFRLAMSTFLFPQRYDEHDKNHVLFLATGEAGSQAEHVIRFDTTDHEWSFIKRRISFNTIRVTITTMSDKYNLEVATRWEVDPASYWGPCYDAPGKTSRQHIAIRKSATVPGGSLDSSTSRARDFERPKPSQQNPTAMRQQTLWKPPSVFANPFKPIIPLNAPAIEPLLRVGQRLPTVTLAQRTPTESARLENEIHTLRYLLLGRISECPFAGCERKFQQGDREALDAHIKQDHAILRCPYCHVMGRQGPGSEGELYFQDEEKALRHFYDNHFLQLMSQARAGANGMGLIDDGTPNVVLNNAGRKSNTAGYKYCDQCGRNHLACHDLQDRQNHKEKCLNLNPANLRPGEVRNIAQYCEYCGAAYNGSCSNKTCPAKMANSTNPAPAICCLNCGLTWASYDAAYVNQHRSGCKPLGGDSWSYCGFCGIPYADLDPISKAGHGQVCSRRPTASPLQCAECTKLLRTPDEVRDHLRSEHSIREECPWCEQKFPSHDRTWTYEVKAHHFAGHMGAHPQVNGVGTGTKVGLDDLKCPGFVDCGVIVSQMSGEQYADHMFHNHAIAMQSGKRWHPNGLNMMTYETSESRAWPSKTQDPPAKSGGGLDTEDWTPRFEWHFTSAQRAASPVWDDVGPVNPYSGTSNFQPGEDMRCSRCFTPAPIRGHRNREYEIDLHSTKKYSCQIRRAAGEFKATPGYFPNRSGWIKFPKDFDFKATRRSFLAVYPAYEGTIFPIDDDRVDAVYGNPKEMRGQRSDDIFHGITYSAKRKAQHQLPWPPHPGSGFYRNKDGGNVTWHTVADGAAAPAASAPQPKFGSGATATAVAREALARPTKGSHGEGTGSRTEQQSEDDSSTSESYVEDSITSQNEEGGFSPDEDEDVNMRNAVPEPSVQHARRNPRDRDAHDQDFDRPDEPDEEHDDRIGQKDGAYEDFSVVEPGMKALPAEFRSPLDAEFPSRKRFRTPRGEAANIDDGGERPTKRVKGVSSALNLERSVVADNVGMVEASGVSKSRTKGARSRTNTPAILEDDDFGDKKVGARPKATPKARTKKATNFAPEFEGGSAVGPVTPSIECMDEPPPTTTRKSSRTIKSAKKVSYVDDTTADDTAEDAAIGVLASHTSTKTPAKRARKKDNDDKSVSGETTSNKTPVRGSAKAIVKKPAKRGRKRAEADEVETAGPTETVALPRFDGVLPRRQPRFK